MNLPIVPPYAPMEARLVRELPRSTKLLFEPKWDGFRCLCFRDGSETYLQSKSMRPLSRYFPEIVEMVKSWPLSRVVLDGELVVQVEDKLDFDQLLQRIHPAESRVRRLASEFPARLIVFDVLVDADGKNIAELPLEERRRHLERLFEKLPRTPHLQLSNATKDRATAAGWLTKSDSDIDGVIAKRLDCTYLSGDRDGMFKVKRLHTADCVIGGYRVTKDGEHVASLLLGLYDADGALHYVGFTSSLSTEDRAHIEPRLKKLKSDSAFTGRSPGGPSRWSRDKPTDWVAVRPEIVIEIGFDHVTGGRFRHGTRALRFRPDKAPRQCTIDQME
jgi:ATP-dependent DNA ligase